MDLKQRRRILIYSHDAYGLGNIRRTLAICESLNAHLTNASVLLLTGSPHLNALHLPRNVDSVKIPCIQRHEAESFESRYWEVELDEIIKMRANIMLAAVKSFKPDLIIVDKKPLGIKREFLSALLYARKYLPQTQIVLGLRDILDAPAKTTRVWAANHYHEAIIRFYDRVWIYGDPELFNAALMYQWPQPVVEMTRFTGYFDRNPSPGTTLPYMQVPGPDRKYRILATVGGGGDGFSILQNYVRAISLGLFANNIDHRFICGPEMSADQRASLHESARGLANLQMLNFTPDMISEMSAADVILAMGGYNTTCEILSLNKNAVIIPRARPVEEQLIRTERLATMGLVKMIHPDTITAQVLSNTINRAILEEGERPDAREILNFNGLDYIGRMAASLLGVESTSYDVFRKKELCA